jgi:hypothetical protein
MDAARSAVFFAVQAALTNARDSLRANIIRLQFVGQNNISPAATRYTIGRDECSNHSRCCEKMAIVRERRGDKNDDAIRRGD